MSLGTFAALVLNSEVGYKSRVGNLSGLVETDTVEANVSVGPVPVTLG